MCGRQKKGLPPKGVYLLTPGTCEYVPSQGKRVFADMIKLRVKSLEMWRLAWIILLGPWNHKGPYAEEGGQSQRERFEDLMLLALKMEEGTTSPGTQAASKSWKRQGNGFSPKASRRTGPANTLILAQSYLFCTSDLQNYKRINLCCF